MKRFAFSLQKILEYKGRLEDKEKGVLAQMRAQHKKLCKQRTDLEAECEAEKADFVRMCGEGCEVQKLSIARSYIDEIYGRIRQVTFLIERAEQEINAQINKLTQLAKERNSMEKLRERHLSEYQEKSQKEAEIFIDDFVANTTHAKSR